MKAKFYILYLKPKNESLANYDQIEMQLNKAINWIRMPPYTWILYSTSSPSSWYKRLVKFAKSGGSLFVSELEVRPGHRAGWMSKNFWNWLSECLRKNMTT